MKTRSKRPQILIHPTLKQEIAKELDCSIQTIMMAINYLNNSKLGIAIRKKAQQKLIKEANEVSL